MNGWASWPALAACHCGTAQRRTHPERQGERPWMRFTTGIQGADAIGDTGWLQYTAASRDQPMLPQGLTTRSTQPAPRSPAHQSEPGPADHAGTS